MDVADKGPIVWRWHRDPEGPSTIMVTRVEWDDYRGRERSVVEEERGFWASVHERVVRLQPDYRRSAHAILPWHRNLRISIDPRRQVSP